ncbi:MAG: MGMT family protein [Armatimonadetes bacterium]|nr:MGMT family protein [Armatimonadota bacterium]
MDDRQYFEAIFAVVRAIPPGRVMSYGQVGRETGCAARTVGWAMANVPGDDSVPWQRVVGADGYLRIGRRSVALQDVQRKLLEREGVTFLENGCVDMARHQVGNEPPPTLELAFE